jgi:hypothetical protein
MRKGRLRSEEVPDNDTSETMRPSPLIIRQPFLCGAILVFVIGVGVLKHHVSTRLIVSLVILLAALMLLEQVILWGTQIRILADRLEIRESMLGMVRGEEGPIRSKAMRTSEVPLADLRRITMFPYWVVFSDLQGATIARSRGSWTKGQVSSLGSRIGVGTFSRCGPFGLWTAKSDRPL